jgi:hypothetical protein
MTEIVPQYDPALANIVGRGVVPDVNNCTTSVLPAVWLKTLGVVAALEPGNPAREQTLRAWGDFFSTIGPMATQYAEITGQTIPDVTETPAE